MNGIVIVDKPAGWTSQDVAARLRRVYGTRRVGHGGTLDPLATGVLPVFVGRATRAVEFLQNGEKTYEAVLRLGTVTDTQDITGTVLRTGPVSVTEEALLAVLPRFRGEILQEPPMYSAVKIGGKKLYELARAGKTVERQARPVTVFSLECLAFSGQTARLLVRCSKGTYIRTLCADLGEALGCGGCMEALRRTAAGRFTLADAAPLDRLLECPEPEKYLRPVDSLFADLPSVRLTSRQERLCRCGNPFPADLPDGAYRVYGEKGDFLMVGRAQDGTLRTVKSFFEVDRYERT